MKDAGLERNAWVKWECGDCGEVHKPCSCRKECSCDKCFKNKCSFPYPEEVKDLIEKINNFIYLKGRQLSNYISRGFPEVCLKNIADLSIYLEVLKNLHESLYLDSIGFKTKICYCPSDYENIKSEILSIIGLVDIVVRDEVVDDSGKAEYLLKHPNAISFERWKKYYYRLVPEFNFSVEKIDDPRINNKPLQVVYEVFKREKKELDIMISAVKKQNKEMIVDYNAKSFENKCKVDYSVLIKDIRCKDISYSVFVAAAKCGYTASFIKSIYKCGWKVVGSKNGGCSFYYNKDATKLYNCKEFQTIIKKIEQCVNIH